MRFNKEIRKFKIALTSKCCLRCSHCFVDKERSETISLAAAERGLRLFLDSPGADKSLEIYGGEPLLEFPLVEKVAASARSMARARGVRLAVSVASNGVLAEDRHLDYMASNGVRFSVSFSGTRKTHDLARKFPSGRGSYGALIEKIPAFVSRLGELLHVIFCVHPARSANAYEDFRRMTDMGLRNIGIECVHGAGWRARDYADFESSMRRIASYAAREAKAGRFLFLDPFMEVLIDKFYPHKFCPFLRDLEMFPDGTLSLYPYPFVKTRRQRSRVAVGTAARGIRKEFAACAPSADSTLCRDCAGSYYTLPGLDDGSRAYRLRTAVCREAVGALVDEAGAQPECGRYLKRMVELFKRGYF